MIRCLRGKGPVNDTYYSVNPNHIEGGGGELNNTTQKLVKTHSEQKQQLEHFSATNDELVDWFSTNRPTMDMNRSLPGSRLVGLKPKYGKPPLLNKQ